MHLINPKFLCLILKSSLCLIASLISLAFQGLPKTPGYIQAGYIHLSANLLMTSGMLCFPHPKIERMRGTSLQGRIR